MDDKTIIAALLGAMAGYWWAQHRAAQCKCNAQQAQAAADPLAWLGQWQA